MDYVELERLQVLWSFNEQFSEFSCFVGFGPLKYSSFFTAAEFQNHFQMLLTSSQTDQGNFNTILGEGSCSVHILSEQADLESVLKCCRCFSCRAEWLDSASKTRGLGKYLL